MNGTVAVVGDARAERLLGPIAGALQHHGCVVARFASADELRGDARSAVAGALLAMSHIVCDGALLDRMPNLRLLASPMTGTEGFDVAAATERGVAVANAQTPATIESMAEATMLFILAALYDLGRSERILRDGLSEQTVFARMLKGRTVGLVGYGAIARGLCERLAGWGVEVLVYARREQSGLPAYARQAPLDTVIAQSDVLALLVALAPETRQLLDARRLRMLKPGAVLVNTSRGALIDEAALIEVLRERPDLRVALDTYEAVPLPGDSPLREVEGAILTPHRVGHTIDAITALQAASVDNVIAALSGELPPGLRNQAIADAWLRRWRKTA